MSNPTPLQRFLSYYRPQRGLFIIDTICALVIAGIDLAFPQILRTLTYGLFSGPHAAILDSLTLIAIGLVTLYAVRMGCKYVVGALGHIMGARMESQMREDLFCTFERMSFSYFDRNNSGDMMSRIVNDLADIAEACHHGPEWLIICTLEIVGAFAILGCISWKLTVVMIAITAVMTVFVYRKNKEMGEVFMENRRRISKVNAQVKDSLSGIRVAKSFANEAYELAKFKDSNEAFLKSKENMYYTMGRYFAFNSFITGMLYTAVLVCGGYFIAHNEMHPIDLATFALYISLFTAPVQTLIDFSEMYQDARAGFMRLCEVLDMEPEILDAPDAVELKIQEGKIVYDHVSFAYEDKHCIIDDLTFTINPGTTVALVGPSGGGKTTTCSLLERFYDVDTGSITIDGQDIRSVTQDSLHAAIGLVQQDIYMFDGTIAQNIAYGKPGATLAEIQEAARKANIHDFIESLEDGYDTQVGEFGTRLSGGQKQRISIARVFLKNPAILILDEATSALDNESEEAVQDSLYRLAENRTALVIAHRLSTIKNADEILVLEDGVIKERGTHDELLGAGGTYARYYLMQFEKKTTF